MEIKLVRYVRDAVYDTIVDIRKNSPTFLKWFGIELSAEGMKMLCVPEGLLNIKAVFDQRYAYIDKYTDLQKRM